MKEIGSKKFSPSKILMYSFLSLASLLSLFPFYWMFVMATRPSSAYNSIPPTITPGNMLVENFKKVLNQIDFFGAMWNSLVLCIVVTIVVLFISSLAGYAFAKRSEEHTSELQSRGHIVCRLLLEKTKQNKSVYRCY